MGDGDNNNRVSLHDFVNSQETSNATPRLGNSENQQEFPLQAMGENALAAGATPATSSTQRLEDFCEETNFPEFAKYAKDSKAHDVIQEVTKWLVTDKPTEPLHYLLEKYRDMYPMERHTAEQDDNEQVGVEHFIKLFEATRAITHEIVPDEAIRICITSSMKLLQADRVSIFLYDKKLKMLLLTASNLPNPIRVKPGQGIAGSVFENPQTVNIRDCYKDPRFDSTFDKLTGYRTTSMLVKPIFDFEGKVMGVLQAINKKVAPKFFTNSDELCAENFLQLVGITLRNVEVYKDAIANAERAQGMLAMLNALQDVQTSQSLLLSLTTQAKQLVQADTTSVLLLDEATNTVWSVATAGGKEVRLKADQGLVGRCIMTGETQCASDLISHEHWHASENLSDGDDAHTMLIVPLKISLGDNEKKVAGVLVMQNKREFDGMLADFIDEDIMTMETFADIASDHLQGSSLITQSQGGSGNTRVTMGSSEAGRAFDQVPQRSPMGRKSNAFRLPTPDIIEEEEEET